MKVKNLLTLNDIRIRSLFVLVFSLQSAVLGLVALDRMGLGFPNLRAALFFVDACFLPGVLVLRILRIHEIGASRTLLYAVCLSIAAVMSMGLFANFVYPSFGVHQPISELPLVITLTALVVLLCAVCYVRDRDYTPAIATEAKTSLALPGIFLTTLIIGAVVGTYLMNNWHTNIILILLLLLISTIPILVSRSRFIPIELYPFAVISISLSLLFHSSLISNYIWGWDIQFEYHTATLVIQQGLWNPSIPSNLNGMLSVTMLPPILSVLLSMDLVWVFKILFPVLFSLAPLGLYLVIRTRLGPKSAFLSTFFFISLFTFYAEMVQLARQQIAELFLVVLLLVLLDGSIEKTKRPWIMIVFASGLVVSHYGLSYIFMFLLLGAFVIARVGQKGYAGPRYDRLSPSFVLLFAMLCIAWTTLISSGSSFRAGVLIGDRIYDNMLSDFLNSQTSQGLSAIVTSTPSPLHEFSKYLQLLAQLLIVLGVTFAWFGREKWKMNKTYLSFSVVSLGLLFATIALPYLASSLNVTRIYQISLIFLAPYFFIGWKTVETKLRTRRTGAHSAGRNGSGGEFFSAFSIFLAAFLLFNSGFVYEVAHDHPTSVSLNNKIDSPVYNERDVQGGRWLAENVGSQTVFADLLRFQLLGGFGVNFSSLPIEPSDVPVNTHIFLGSYNTANQMALAVTAGESSIEKMYVKTAPLVEDRARVFDNGGVQIYY